MPSVGDLIRGKYRILRSLGDGGMGTVYEARHQLLGINVALKFLHPDFNARPGLAARFLQEGRVSATIKSPHVAQVSDVDTADDGSPFLVMELLQGESLQDLLDRHNKLPVAQAVGFALQILSGLEAAHRLGVVHRDLKPDNVFLIDTDAGPLLKIIDFGIAKLRDTTEYKEVVTLAGTVMGTPEYMPPEQLYAAEQADQRADLYSVGVLLYEMLSGQFPAVGEGAAEIVSRVQLGQITSLSEREPELSKKLVEVVHRAMLPEREQRFQTAAEFKQALLPFAKTETAAPESALPQASPGPPTGLASAVVPPPKSALAPEAKVESHYAKGDTEPGPAEPRFSGPAVLPAAPMTVRSRPRRKLSAVVAVLLVAACVLGVAVLIVYLARPWPSSALPELPPPLPSEPPPAVVLNPQVDTAEPGAPSPPPAPARPPAAPPKAVTPPKRPAATAGTSRKPPVFPFPFPSTLPSSLPPLPSGFPTTLPSTLPTSLPTTWPSTFPKIPGLTPLTSGSSKPVAPPAPSSAAPSGSAPAGTK